MPSYYSQEPRSGIQFDIDSSSLPLTWADKMKLNGFTFNERRVLEVANVSAVDGLMDSDFKDQRIDRVEDEGEDLQNAWRAGRTVVIEGNLEAGNLHSLVNLRQRLKAALTYPDSKDLWFNRYDSDIDFLVSGAIANDFTSGGFGGSFNFDAASGWVTNGAASGYWHSNNPHAQLVENRVIVQKLFVQATVDGNTAENGVFLKTNPDNLQSSNQWKGIGVWVNCAWSSNFSLFIGKISRSGNTYSKSIYTTNTHFGTEHANRTPIWLLATVHKNLLIGQIYDADPINDDGANLLLEHSYDISGVTNPSFGTGQTGSWGILEAAQNTNAKTGIAETRVYSLDPGDIILRKVRRSSSLSGREAQDSGSYKRPFQVTLRAGDPRMYSRGFLRRSFAPTASGTVYSKTVSNDGDIASPPKLVIHGVLGGITITESQTGKQFIFTGSIASGKYLVVDFANRTAIDSDGNDRSGEISPSSNLKTIGVGDSTITVTATSVGSGAFVHFDLYNTWA